LQFSTHANTKDVFLLSHVNCAK